MDILNTIAAVRAYVRDQRALGKTISFVPTMGALHDGHIKLVEEGLQRADVCIPYVFLNPKQFAAHEDLGRYPKTLAADQEKVAAVGAQALYVPQAADIYPDGFSTSVTVSGVSEPLEGEYRPHFFNGVATVLAKMFLHVMPDIALFGEKDYQQLLVIKKLVRDLDYPIEVIGVPTVRDENGLALSSRNAYLTPAQYDIAVQMNRILMQLNSKGEAWGAQALLSAGFDKVDYCTVRDAHSLLPPDATTRDQRALAAAWIGTTRLIDNLPV